ncbi:MAG: membrane-associated phospholipid phosphatase [Neolewinella sp.]|jgi:membrane-associated phospholipid phosphatase
MYTHKFILFLLVFFCYGSLWSQDFPYELNWKKEITIIAGAGALSGLSHLRESQLKGLSSEELAVLNPGAVNGFDRSAIGNRSEPFRNLSDDLLKVSALTPGLLLLGKPARSKPLTLGVMMAETFIVTEGITKLGKVIVRRNRPLTYDADFDPGQRMSENARQSFPSGHTSVTAGMSFFAAKVFHDLYPDSKLRPFVWAGAALLPAATGYARYRAGKHFPTDIIAGYALGATIGILIPELHKPTGQRGLGIDITGNGLGLVLRW